MTYYHDTENDRVVRGTVDAVYTSQGFKVLGEFPEMDQHSTRCLAVKNGVVVLDKKRKDDHEQKSNGQSVRLDASAKVLAALTDPSVKNFEAERKRILGIA